MWNGLTGLVYKHAFTLYSVFTWNAVPRHAFVVVLAMFKEHPLKGTKPILVLRKEIDSGKIYQSIHNRRSIAGNRQQLRNNFPAKL
jgi:hypothetical protein